MFHQHLSKSSRSAIFLAVPHDLILSSLGHLWLTYLDIRMSELKGKLKVPSPKLSSIKQHLEEIILQRTKNEGFCDAVIK